MTTNRIEARREVNTKPTLAQCEAGNYKKGHLLVNGFDITIENPKGSYRCGKDRNGKEWKTLMHHDYGYFRKTVGKDGDAVDVFLGPNLKSPKVYPVDQYINGEFDETKVMMGFNSKEEAKAAYLSNYEKDWKGFKYITEVDIDTFAKWLYDGHRQRKPFAKYSWLKEDKINIRQILCEETGDDLFYDAWENGHNATGILWEFLDDKKAGHAHKHWRLIPANQYYNLLNRFMAQGLNANIPYNIVNGWFAQIIVPNTVDLEILTELCGHSQCFPFDDFADAFGEEWEGCNDYDRCSDYLEEIGFYDWCLLPDGSDAISDYGLEPLFKIIKEYNSEMSPGEILVLINRALDIVHCRGDLSSMFIEGGKKTLYQISSGRMVSEGKRLENDPNRKNKGVAKTPLKAIKAANRAEEIKAHGRSTALRSMVTSKDKTKYDRNAVKRNKDLMMESMSSKNYVVNVVFSCYYNEKKNKFDEDSGLYSILEYIKSNKITDTIIRIDVSKKNEIKFDEYDIYCSKMQIKTLDYEVGDKEYTAKITCDKQSAIALIKLLINLGAYGNPGHSFELRIGDKALYFDGDGADSIKSVNGVKLQGKILSDYYKWGEILKKGEPHEEPELPNFPSDDEIREMIREAILRELR